MRQQSTPLTDEERAMFPYGQQLLGYGIGGYSTVSALPNFDLLVGIGTDQSPFNVRNADVLFRGKPLDSLSREEAIEALHQAVGRIKRGI